MSTDPYGAGAPKREEKPAPTQEQRLNEARTSIRELQQQVLQLRETFTQMVLSGNLPGNVQVYRDLLKRYETESATLRKEFPDEQLFKSAHDQAVALKNANEF